MKTYPSINRTVAVSIDQPQRVLIKTGAWTRCTMRIGGILLLLIALSASLVAAETAETNKTFQTKDGKYHFTMDSSIAPDLSDWANTELAPVVTEWYPKIVKLLPSPGFDAATNVIIRFRDNMRGTPASAGGGRVNCNAEWFRKNLKGEAKGAVVHELCHVVQEYGRARRTNPDAARTPGWIVEGIPDYIRWFIYEPQAKGAEITQRNLSRAKYDGNYRITANFLNWVVEKYDKQIIQKLNVTAREGKYSEDLWKEYTGKTVQDLGDEWRKAHETRLASLPSSTNQVKEAESKQ